MQFQINNGKISATQRNLSYLKGKIKHVVLGLVYTVYLGKLSYVPLHGCIGNWTRKETHPF